MRRHSIRARCKCRRRKISPSHWKSGPSAAWGSFSPLKEWTASTTAARATAISTSSRSGQAMTEVTPARPSQPKLKRRSIKTKILLALLTLSLCPLILIVAINRARMADVQEYVKSQLKQEAEKDLLRAATRQASIANAMLDNVEGQTQMVAFFTEALLRNPAAFGGKRNQLRLPLDR